MAFQDVAHGLVTDGVPAVGQGSDEPVEAPGAILLGHVDNQGFQLLVYDRAPRGLALLGAITLLGDERAMLGEDRVGLDDARHLLQGFPPQLLANLSQRLPIPIAQLDATFDLLAQYPVCCHQILMAQAQFLIDGSRDVR
jgi:hypothetical protein